MTVFTLTDALKPLAIAIRARRGLRLVLAFGTVVLGMLLLFPWMDLPASSFSGAQTQMQLNKEACDEYKKADAELNEVYRRITRDYRQSVDFIAALKKAQLAWISYRDAHLESIYPGDASQYGSINTMCRCTNLAEITKERARVLKRWTDGVEEGDVCAGSMKTK
jgi:uncharacterized protein YecT (DUF1311 family)